MRTNLAAAEAQRIILDAAEPLATETCAAPGALGRVPAERAVRPPPRPAFDVAAMDGYALRAADLEAGRVAELPVDFEMAAGAQPARVLAPGAAARIFTGAPLPPGADTVVRQEDTEAVGS